MQMRTFRGSLKRFSYTQRAVYPTVKTRPETTKTAKDNTAKVEVSKPELPRIPITRPLMSTLRTLLFPSLQREALVKLVAPEVEAMNWPAESREKTRQRLRVIFDGATMSKSGARLTRRQKFHERMNNKRLTLGSLLFFVCQFDHPRYFEKVLRMIELSDVQLTEEHYNPILNFMPKYGWDENAKKLFQDMHRSGVKCRLEAIFTLVVTAVKRRDFIFAEELMTILTTSMYRSDQSLSKPFPMEVVVDGCVGAKRSALGTVEKVLQWHRITKVALSSRTVDSLIAWVRSLGESHEIHNADISSDGQCSNCGRSLEPNKISESEHRLILSEVEEAITGLEERFIGHSELNQLKELIGKHNFGAVLDGMNVGMGDGLSKFRARRVIKVAEALLEKHGRPVLVVLRWHRAKDFCHKNLSQEDVYSFLLDKYGHRGIYFFFAQRNADDDLYCLYASLASGRDTYLVTNDHLRDKRAMLVSSEHTHLMLDQWTSGHVVRHNRGTTIPVIPLQYKRVVQWSKSGRWHLPYRVDTEDGEERTLCINIS